MGFPAAASWVRAVWRRSWNGRKGFVRGVPPAAMFARESAVEWSGSFEPSCSVGLARIPSGSFGGSIWAEWAVTCSANVAFPPKRDSYALEHEESEQVLAVARVQRVRVRCYLYRRSSRRCPFAWDG
jgi:hypothetical protein